MTHLSFAKFYMVIGFVFFLFFVLILIELITEWIADWLTKDR